MDFQSLSRKELQVLCKKNKIPANMTNVAMADALAALPNVEGIDEIGNTQSALLSPQTHKGSSRRPIKQTGPTATENEPKSSVTATRTRRGALKTVNQEVEKETIDNNPPRSILKTPAPRTTRRRATAATSVCKNVEDDKREEKDGKDEGKSVRTRGCTTRRSTRMVSEKKGKSITAAFESSALSEAEDGTSENDQGNTEETLNAQTEESDLGSQVTDGVVSSEVVSVDEVLVNKAKNSEGDESVINRDIVDLGDFSVDGDQAVPQDDVNQVLDTSSADANQVQSFVVDPPKLDEADISESHVGKVEVLVESNICKMAVEEVQDIAVEPSELDEVDISESDVGKVVVPVASDISEKAVNEVQNCVVDPLELDEAVISKSDVGEVVFPEAEDISKTGDVDEALVAVGDVSNVNANEVLISKPLADQCLISTEDQVSVEDISKTGVNEVLVAVDDSSSANEVLVSAVDATKPLAHQFLIPAEGQVSVEDGINAVEVCNNPVAAFDNENQSEDETSGKYLSDQLTSLEKTEIQMHNNVNSAADQVEKTDPSLLVQAEIEIEGNQNRSETEGLETLNEPSEITAVVVPPFSSSTTSTPCQVPTTPKLTASSSKHITSQMKSSNKKATPILKMGLEVYKEDNDVAIAAEEKDKPSSNSTMNVVEDKENNTKGENTVQKSLKKKSLRKLKVLLKEKLVMGGNGKEKMQMEKMRPALQTLTDNCMVGNEEN